MTMPTRSSLHRGKGPEGKPADSLLLVRACARDAMASRSAFAKHEAQHTSRSALAVLFNARAMPGYHLMNVYRGVYLTQSPEGWVQSIVTTRLEHASEWSLHFPLRRPWPTACVSSGSASGVQKLQPRQSIDSQWCVWRGEHQPSHHERIARDAPGRRYCSSPACARRLMASAEVFCRLAVSCFTCACATSSSATFDVEAPILRRQRSGAHPTPRAGRRAADICYSCRKHGWLNILSPAATVSALWPSGAKKTSFTSPTQTPERKHPLGPSGARRRQGGGSSARRVAALAAAAVVLDLPVVQVQREGLVPLGMQPAEEERLLPRAALHDHLERRG